MIPSISFGSTYKVNNIVNNKENFEKFETFAFRQRVNHGAESKTKKHTASEFPYIPSSECTLAIHDRYDYIVDSYLENRGIKFKKMPTEDVLNPQTICSRTKKPKKGMFQVPINTDRLKRLCDLNFSNYSLSERDYYDYYESDVEFMLRSGDEYPATTIHIKGKQSTEKELENIKKFGPYLLEPGHFYIELTKKADDYDHLVLFALRDMGVKNVPVYVDKDTYKIADALGIIAEEK